MGTALASLLGAPFMVKPAMFTTCLPQNAYHGVGIQTFRESIMTYQGLVCGLLLTGALCGCNAVDSMKEGFEHSNAVAADLEKSLGSKPFVGFNWANGTLVNVTVEFGAAPAGRSLDEIEAATRDAVQKEFAQTPQKIVLAFDLAAK